MSDTVNNLYVLGLLMPVCAECVFMEDPSPTIIRCRLKGTYHYLDDPACESFKPYRRDGKRRG